MSTSTPKLPQDYEDHRSRHGNPIQVLAPAGVAYEGSVTGASARIGPFPDGAVLRVWAASDCRFKFGDGTVVAVASGDATSIPLTAFQSEFYSLKAGQNYVAFILQPAATAGTFHAVELT